MPGLEVFAPSAPPALSQGRPPALECSSPGMSSYICLEGFCLCSVAASRACGWRAAHFLKRRKPQQAWGGGTPAGVLPGDAGPRPPERGGLPEPFPQGPAAATLAFVTQDAGWGLCCCRVEIRFFIFREGALCSPLALGPARAAPGLPVSSTGPAHVAAKRSRATYTQVSMSDFSNTL